MEEERREREGSGGQYRALEESNENHSTLTNPKESFS